MSLIDLHSMFEKGDLTGIKKSIHEGYDVESLDDFGQNCLHLACWGDHVDVAAFLISHGTNVNTMETREGSLDWMRPIHIAVLRNSMDLANMLISAGADVNLVTGGTSGGYTCVHMVRSSKMTRILINAGANINTKEEVGGMTPLMLALENSMVDVARTLVNAGADVNICMRDGSSLLDSVKDSVKCSQWVSKVTTILVEAGAC